MKKLIKVNNLYSIFFCPFPSWRIAHFLAKDGFPLDRAGRDIRPRTIKLSSSTKPARLFTLGPDSALRRSSFDLLAGNIATSTIESGSTIPVKMSYIIWHAAEDQSSCLRKLTT
jgi:hypothetical protein